MTTASPCEGTGYEIGGMSVIKGAKNLENAKKWYDWALTAEAQNIGARAKRVSGCTARRRAESAAALAPNLGLIELINYDFAKYDSTLERTRLLGVAGNLDAAEVLGRELRPASALRGRVRGRAAAASP